MRRHRLSRTGLGALLAMLAAWPATAVDTIEVASFSRLAPGAALPEGWRRFVIGRPHNETEYSFVSEDGRTVLRADSRDAHAALIHPLRADPKATPWLSWSWRVDTLPPSADLGTKAGDDYAARVYVLFDYDVAKLPFGERTKVKLARLVYGDTVPAAGICYVWDNKHRVGHSDWSAYTSRLRLVVLETGPEHLGRWRRESRNLAEDFRAAFGEEPPAIAAVVVATDTDNTHESARAYFGDISLRGTPDPAR